MEKKATQLKFEDLPENQIEGKTTVYCFPEGEIIYPYRGRRGVLQGDALACRLFRQKVHGLSAFQLRSSVVIYLNGRYWTLPTGSLFGAYCKKGRKTTIKTSFP